MERKRSLFYTDPKTRQPTLEPVVVQSNPGTPYTPMHVDAWIRPKKSVDVSSRHNDICEICLGPATYMISMDAKCMYCNVVCHVACLDEDERTEVLCGSWACKFCQSDIEADKSNFLGRKLRSIRMVRISPFLSLVCIREHFICMCVIFIETRAKCAGCYRKVCS